jgi:hypothetical protein
MRATRTAFLLLTLTTCPACSSGSVPGSGRASYDAAGGGMTDAASESGGAQADGAISGGEGGASSSGGSSQCQSPSDCKTHAQNCGTCTCIALGANEPAPDCDGGTIKCSPDPCTGKTATCDGTGQCALQ